jgi:K+-sensing histidine kinase KdpD
LKARVLASARIITGLLVCLVAASLVSVTFSHSNFRLFVPLGFAVILILLGSRFGLSVTVFGSVLAAMVFAYRLFPPLGSLRVDDPMARQNLAWMILASVACSFLLFPPTKRHHR